MAAIGDYYESEVLPALFDVLDRAFPEFDWVRCRGGWKAGKGADPSLLAQIGGRTPVKPEKIVCLEKKPGGYYCNKNGEATGWPAYVIGGHGASAPRGDDFARAVRILAELAGVAPGPGRDEQHDRKRWRAEAEKRKRERDEKDEKDRRESIAYAWQVWQEAKAESAPIEAYFAARGLDVVRLRGVITALYRFGRMSLNDERTAILCPVVDAGGGFVGLQRIAVDTAGAPITDVDGAKIKKMLGRPLGGAVRIGPRTETLYLAEGVETAMAVHQVTGCEVWATLSTSGLKAVDLRGQEGRSIIIAADLDASGAGQEAAWIAHERIRSMGFAVAIAQPSAINCPSLVVAGEDGDRPRDGKSVDWLDVLVHAGERAAGVLISAVERVDAPDEPPPAPPDDSTEEPSEAPQRPILWPGQTRRSRLAAHRVWGPPRGQRAGQRFGLAYWSRFGHWLEYGDGRWRRITDEQVHASLVEFFDGFDIATRKPIIDEHGREVTQKYAGLTVGEIRGIAEHMKACCMVDDDELPAWAPPTYDGDEPVFERWRQRRVGRGEAMPDPTMVLAVGNGLLRLDAWDEGRVVVEPHTPRFLSTQKVPHEIPCEELAGQLRNDPDNETIGFEVWSKRAPTFARFLDSLCEGDERKQASLLEWLGYCLTPDVSLETALVLTGPPGSGKGTFIEAVRAMMSDELVGTTSFTSLARPHHTFALMGLAVAVMHDAHVSDMHADRAIEVAKSIASGDPISVEEKYGREDSKFPLRLKLMICCNELPRFPDPSGSWAQRLLVVPMTQGYRRRPDRTIKRGVQREGLGILLAALFGRRRLLARGEFTRPADGMELLRQYELDNAPVQAFVDDCCEIGEGYGVSTDILYYLYRSYAHHNGMREMGKPKFGENLRMAVPHRGKKEKVIHGRRINIYTGLRPHVRVGFDGRDVVDWDDLAAFDFEVRRPAGESPPPPFY